MKGVFFAQSEKVTFLENFFSFHRKYIKIMITYTRLSYFICVSLMKKPVEYFFFSVFFKNLKNDKFLRILFQFIGVKQNDNHMKQ